MQRVERGRRIRQRVKAGWSEGGYYGHVSTVYQLCFLALVFLLMAVIVLNFVANQGFFTYKSIFNMLRRISIFDNVNSSYLQLNYSSTNKESYGLYRKGLVAVGDTSIDIFSSTGKKSFSETISYHEPRIVTSSSYVLLFDQKGTEFSLYNAYSSVFTGTSEFPIFDAFVSADGYFGLVVKNDKNQYEVRLFNPDFARIGSYKKNGPVYAVFFDDKTSSICICSYRMNQNVFTTEISSAKVGALDYTFSAEFNEGFPVRFYMHSKGNYQLLTSEGSYLLDFKGNLLSSSRFDRTADFCSNGTSGFVIAYRNEGLGFSYTVDVFDIKNDKTHSFLFEGRILDMTIGEKDIFFMTENAVFRYDDSGNPVGELEVSCDGRELVAISDERIALCTQQNAIYYSIN